MTLFTSALVLWTEHSAIRVAHTGADHEDDWHWIISHHAKPSLGWYRVDIPEDEEAQCVVTRISDVPRDWSPPFPTPPKP